jgi:quercetin dioxygenase-like cupin family protein
VRCGAIEFPILCAVSWPDFASYPLHYVVEGRIKVQLDGEEIFGLNSGEVVMFPHNDAHLLGSELDLPASVG